MSASTFASRAFRFYSGLACPETPRQVTVMNPYTDSRVRGYVRTFLDNYFSDNLKRVLVLGINPGRFGAGITGVTFTDPITLADNCGIENDLPRRHELSSIFIYRVIERFGGPREFYRRFFLTAVSPLGFTADGRNLNYYDDPVLTRAVTPFITNSIERQIAIGSRLDRAIVLGLGDNARFLHQLNERHGFFRRVDALEHPRWIMQYRRRELDNYVAKYEEVFALDNP
jgi:hypothetical protein